MRRIYNLKSQKIVRKNLRNNMTPAEVMIWSKLKGKQLLGYKFRRQHGVGKYIVDFYCAELKLIVEIDGDVHGFSAQIKKDKERQKYLENLNFIVKRYQNDDVLLNLNGVADDLYRFCQNRTTPCPSLERRGLRGG
jgi:very-short-patch-repair endonuclease